MNNSAVGDLDSDVEGSQATNADRIEQYRALLLDIDNKETKKNNNNKHTDLEISWRPELQQTAQDIVRKKQAGEDKLSPWDEYLLKKKRKKINKEKENTQVSVIPSFP